MIVQRIRNKLISFFDRYTIYLILLFAFLTLFTYIFKPLEVSYQSGIVYRIIIISLIGVMFLIGLFAYRYKPPLPIIILSLLYGISNAVTIFVAPIVKDTSVEINKQIMGLGVIFSTLITIGITIWLVKNYVPSDLSINICCLILIAFSVIACVYSYITQYEAIYKTFTEPKGWDFDVTSFFADKTSYGFCLFISSTFSVIFALKNKKYWFYLFSIFFLVNMFISRSKTSVICTSLLLITVLIYHFATSFKKHKKAWIISLSAVVGILIILSLFTFIPALRIGPFNNIYTFISKVIIGDGITVMSDRFYKWGKVFVAMDNPLIIIMGCGERIANDVLTTCGCATIGDSIYVSNYGTGGIIKFVLYLAFAIYIIYLTFKSSNNKWNKFIVMSIQIILMISGFFEDDNLLGITMTSLLMLIPFYLPNKVIEKQKSIV